MDYSRHWETPPAGIDPYVLGVSSGLLPRGFGLDGMGDVATDIAAYDPEPISAAALNLIGSIQGLLGGNGHLDANVITPIQNRVVSDVIAPLSAAINNPNSNQYSLSQLQQMQAALVQTQAAWLNFLHNTHWNDTRAATQAEATLAPYFTNGLNWFNTAIANAAVSSPAGIATNPIVTNPNIPGSGPIVTLPLIPVSSGFDSNTILLIGAGVLVLMMFSKSKV